MSTGSVLGPGSVAPDCSVGFFMRSLEISDRFESEVSESDKSDDSMDDESDCEEEVSVEEFRHGEWESY